MNKMALVRIIAFALVWLNQILVQKGLQPLPVLDEQIIADVIAFVVSVWTLATHNSLAKKDKP